MSKQRTRRISEEIKKIVSHQIMFNMKDPRISRMTSVVHVDTTNDLSYTTIYISVYDPKQILLRPLKVLTVPKGLSVRKLEKS